MCGGRGTRLDVSTEKPLYEIGGRSMVDRVCDALVASRVETIHPVASSHTPQTCEHFDEQVIETPGDGYVADLQYALERIDPPVLTVAADLPLLTGDAIDTVLDKHMDGSLTVFVPATLKRVLGVSIDTTMDADGWEVAPTGINVVSERDAEDTFTTYDARFAVNVNRRADATVAEKLV